MQKIKIYGDYGSGSTRRVTTIAEALGIDFDFINTDLLKGESQAAEFVKLNPNKKVPLMVDGDVVLYESSAINIYLAEKTKSPLFPESGSERYEVLKWMFWSGEEWRIFCVSLFDERIVKKLMKTPASSDIDHYMMRKLKEAAGVLNSHFAHNKFIVGDKITLADIDVAGPFSQIDRVKLPFREFPNIMRWHEDLINALPAWKKTGEQIEKRMEEDFMPIVRKAENS